MSVQHLSGALRRFAGIGANNTGHLEKWVAGAGGLTGILGVMLISQAFLGLSGSASLVASMGASAVLLFAVPHGPLSQPWAVTGGHMVSAVIGVACAQLNAQPFIASALAVALAISAMHYLRCIHPPGGATALTAVTGGDAVHALGFHYILSPVLLNVLVILLVAMLFNFPFPWRRYPAAWTRKQNQPAVPDASGQAIKAHSREDHPTAARATDPALPISGNQLDTTCSHLAACNPEFGIMYPADIRIGRCYCNGAFGQDWQVRRVIDSAGPGTTESSADGTIVYRVVAGSKRRQTGAARREDFAVWARYEVCLNENSWQRVATKSHTAITGDAA
jgi:CBS-domain-containing membrane protein